MKRRNSNGKGNRPTEAQIQTIVEGARWAPSGDNNQSISFEWDGEKLIVREDAERSRAFINVGNAASQLALGMCMANIELVAAQKGWATRWTTETQDPVVAQVRFVALDRSSSTTWDPLLAEAIQKRTVDRRPFYVEQIPLHISADLNEITQNTWGIRFYLIDQPSSVIDLARINSRFESFLIGHKSLHSYLFRWMRWSNKHVDDTHDGMPLETMGLNFLFKACFRFIAHWHIARLIKVFRFNWIAEVRARRVYSRSAAFGAFTIPNTQPLTYVRVGWLWQRAWLMLTSKGWALQPVMGHALMGHLCDHFNGTGLTSAERIQFEKETREMRSVIGISPGQSLSTLFRLGRSIAPLKSRAPRRRLSDLLTRTGEETRI